MRRGHRSIVPEFTPFSLWPITTSRIRLGFYIDRKVKITTFAGSAQCANPAEAKFAHSAAKIDGVDLWAALELLDLPPPPWAAVRQPARARLAAAGAAQTERRP